MSEWRTLVEIDSYEPYHIGIKLQSHISLETLGGKLRKTFKEKGFDIPERAVTEMTLPILPSREVLGVKDGVRVEFNVPVQALNTIGAEPEKVMNVFKDLISILSSLEYDLGASIAFYEIVASINIKTEKHPREAINKSIKADLGAFAEYGEIVKDSFRIVNVAPTEKQGQINMTVEPSPSSPNTKYLIRLLYRVLEIEQIENFHQKLAERLIEVIESLESE